MKQVHRTHRLDERVRDGGTACMDGTGCRDPKSKLTDEPTVGSSGQRASEPSLSCRKRETAGSDDSQVQSDNEVEREAVATPDPSWHSESGASATPTTTDSTP